MQASCRNRSIGANVVSVTLTVRNRSGSNSLTKNVDVNKIAGCF
jgi:PKD repeat protein